MSSNYSIPEELRLSLLPPPYPYKDGVLPEHSALALHPEIWGCGIRAEMPADEAIQALKSYQKTLDENAELLRLEEEIFNCTLQLRRQLEEVEKTESRIRELKKEKQKFKLQAARDASGGENKNQKRGRGRPRPISSPEHQAAIQDFVASWVKCVKNEMAVQTCSDLGSLIPGSDQRNWRNWQNGKTIPSPKSFLEVITSRITRKGHEHLGKCLAEISTTPESHDLYCLLIEIG